MHVDVASGYGDGNVGKHVCAGTGQGKPFAFADRIKRENCKPKTNKAMTRMNTELILNCFNINFSPG